MQSLNDLKAYKSIADPQAESQLINTIAQARKHYQNALSKRVKTNNVALLNLSN